jgi:hypothetical protein
MRKTYRILALLIAVEVVVQAAALAWAMFGLGAWIDEGNTFNKTMLECSDCPWNFTEERGFMIHGLNGMILIPLLSLVLLVVSFFVRDKTLLRWAGLVFVLVMVQSQVLPYAGREYPVFGALHGLNALVLFAAALATWRKGKVTTPAAAMSPQLSGTA